MRYQDSQNHRKENGKRLGVGEGEFLLMDTETEIEELFAFVSTISSRHDLHVLHGADICRRGH